MSFGIFFEVIECSSRKGESLVFDECSIRFNDFCKFASSNFLKQFDQKTLEEAVERLPFTAIDFGTFLTPCWLHFGSLWELFRCFLGTRVLRSIFNRKKNFRDPAGH